MKEKKTRGWIIGLLELNNKLHKFGRDSVRSNINCVCLSSITMSSLHLSNGLWAVETRQIIYHIYMHHLEGCDICMSCAWVTSEK